MSTSKGAEKKSKGGRTKAPAKGKLSLAAGILAGLAVAVALAGIYLVLSRQGPESGETDPAGRTNDFQVLVGRWVRPDGGYVISVNSVAPDGRVDAGYFNPRPINVSRAEAKATEGRVKLFIELQAAGYPGSTYDLVYDPGHDALVGIYFQAAMQQRFEVVFVRQ
jgi:hypothetical protein